MEPLKMYINGHLTGGLHERVVRHHSPAGEGGMQSLFYASVEDCQAALTAVQDGFERWAAMSMAERAAWLKRLSQAAEKHRQEFRELVAFETGRPLIDADELDALHAAIHYNVEEVGRLWGNILPDCSGRFHHQIVYEPVGPVVAMLPWNFPLGCLAVKLAQALAAGCSIILKPSVKAPLSAYYLGRVCHEIDFPAGVINILCGEDPVIPQTLAASPVPAMLTMIGSTNSGRALMAAGSSSIKRYNLELSGNAPALIFEDADLDQAFNTLVTFKFGNAGQVCVAPNRIFVHPRWRGELVERFVERARNIVLGSGKLCSPWRMGPVIDMAAKERLHALVQDAVSKGANLVWGDDQVPVPSHGSYYPPTILTGVTEQMQIYQQEIFGPVVAIIDMPESETEVIRMANDGECGLASYIFTRDLPRAVRLARQLRYGEVMINGIRYAEAFPHIGIRQSGIGADHSRLGLMQYLSPKRITLALET